MQQVQIPVNVGEGYNVLIGAGLLQDCGGQVRRAVGCCRAAVVTDSNVAPLYLGGVMQSLAAAGMEPEPYVFSAGERSKNMRTLSDILEFLAQGRFTRADCVVALGGGVTGDMAGFAAGCYLRGIKLVQLPTTLLAAVDSSVGGKTAVDLAAGKNLAGLFLQPSLVLCDTNCMATLGDGALADGAAEAVKAGVLSGGGLFALVEGGNIRQNLAAVIAGCVEFKAGVVEEDEREGGLRRILNLGHTIGHAIEKCSGFEVPHGRAVAMGLAAVARAACRMGRLAAQDAGRILLALKNNGLPTGAPFGPEQLFEAALADKKRTGGSITLVLPNGIGKWELLSMPVGELKGFIELGAEELHEC